MIASIRPYQTPAENPMVASCLMQSSESPQTILVRRTRDPCVADVEYIAYSRITLAGKDRFYIRDLGVGTGDSKEMFNVRRIYIHLTGDSSVKSYFR